MPAAGTPSSLPVIGRRRRHVAHQHCVERADIDPQFERRRADQDVQLLPFALELILDALTLVVRDLSRVLSHAQHRVVAVEHPQVEVVLGLVLPHQPAAAAPGEAEPGRSLPDGGAPALLAAVAAGMGVEHELAAVNLVRSGTALQRAAPAGECRRHEQLLGT